MAIDEHLADRLRRALSERGIEWQEKRMFGSLVLLVGGEIVIGVRGGGGLLVRCDPDESGALLRDAGPWYAQRARMGRKEMSDSWVDVSPDAVETRAHLDHWVEVALRH